MNIDTAKEEIVQSGLEVTGEGEGTDPARNQGASCWRRRQGQNQLPSLVCQPLLHVCVSLAFPSLACSFVFTPGSSFLAWSGHSGVLVQIVSKRSFPALSAAAQSCAGGETERDSLRSSFFFNFIPVWVSAQNFIHLVWVQNFKFVSFYAGNYWPTTIGNCKGVSTIPMEKKLLFLHVGCLEAQTSQTKFLKESEKDLILLF